MSKLRHVLKLYCNGTTVLQISTITGVSRNTVKKYIAVLRNLRTTWEEIARLSDKDLTELFCKEPDDAPDARLVILHEFFKQHDKRLRQRGMTLLRLWEQYIRDNEHGYHVSAFYRHHRLWTRRAKPSMHMEHTAGDKMFVDYTGVRLQIVDTETGVITPVEVFVAILGASQLTYVEATASQRAVDFITCCEHALQYFGGAPQAIVPDNLKSAVTKSNRYEPQLNENFAAFADHYGMAVLPARAYRPKDKALVEGAVKITYNKIFASLPEELPTSLEQLNALIQSLLIAYNGTVFKGRSYSRMDQFLEFEQATLQPLPQQRFELRTSRVATVMKNGHIHLQVDKHYYSVPYAYISKKVRVIYSASTVEIFYKYELIASHRRLRKAHNYTTDAAHLASQHQAMSEWSADFFLAKAREITAEVEQYIAQVLLKKQHPEQAYKTCQGILSFAGRVGHHRLSRACTRAHSYGLYHYRAIESILNKGLDLQPDDETPHMMPMHENIRGKDYYNQSTDQPPNTEDDV